MNSEHVAQAGAPKTRKMVFQLVIGGLIGGAVTYAALAVLDGADVDFHDPSRMLALTVGLMLSIIGASVGLGLLAPRAGSKLLNVEDADELREQRRPLAFAALCMLLGGLGMIALAVAAVGGGSGLLSAPAAAMVAAACFLATAALGILSRGSYDEFMRLLGAEAAILTLSALMVIACVWSSLAHLGYLPWITPLGLLAGLVGLQLLATFWVVGRRGLLKPR